MCIELVDGPYLFHQGKHLGKAHVLLATELPEDIYSDSGRILTVETYTTRSINYIYICMHYIYIYIHINTVGI